MPLRKLGHPESAEVKLIKEKTFADLLDKLGEMEAKEYIGYNEEIMR